MRYSHYFVYLLPLCRPQSVDWRHRLKRTWNQASQLCSSHGGYLPRIQSREELNEIISLFKIKNQRLPFIETLFIGLASNISNGVGYAGSFFILFHTCKHVYIHLFLIYIFLRRINLSGKMELHSLTINGDRMTLRRHLRLLIN